MRLTGVVRHRAMPLFEQLAHVEQNEEAAGNLPDAAAKEVLPEVYDAGGLPGSLVAPS